MDFPGASASETVPAPLVHLPEALPNLEDKKGKNTRPDKM